MGYLDYQDDGAGPGVVGPAPPTGADQSLGFRLQKGGRGKIYGPFVVNDPKYFKVDGSAFSFYDAWGKPILYYRSTRSAVATDVFGNSPTTVLFQEADNASGAAITAYDTGAAVASTIGVTPSSNGTSKFWAKIGTTSNTISGGVVPSRDSFLLISAGVDGIYFNDDDVVSSR